MIFAIFHVLIFGALFHGAVTDADFMHAEVHKIDDARPLKFD